MDEESKKRKSPKEKLPDGNSALYCSICATTTSSLEKTGTTALRVETLYDKTLCLCEPCLKELNNRLYSEEEEKKDKSSSIKKMTIVRITPAHLYEQLNQYIIGQEQAKKALSVAVALHLKRIEGHLVDKSNVLLLGPTGTGKTEMARVISTLLNLPLAICDATTLTAHGYVGEDVETILQMLLTSADGDVKRAEKGIIFLDEFDKLAGTGGDYGVNTVAVQQSLLKMLEGGTVKVPKPGGGKRSEEFVTINTSKILFICAGAFAGLRESLNKTTIGLGSSSKEIPKKEEITTKDLSKFGIIPELLGRLPVVITTEQLEHKDLVKILKESPNSFLKSFEHAFRSYGLEAVFEKAFIEDVATEALSSGLGARGLKKILEEKLMPILFSAPSMFPKIRHVSIGKKVKYS